MICSNCRKPYFFVTRKSTPLEGTCENCSHSENFELPSYDGYHDENYVSKDYKRNAKTDPQMCGIFSRLDIQADDIVAELGCGIGDYAVEVSRMCDNYTGYDQSTVAAKSRLTELTFVEANLNEALPIPSNSIDKLISVHVIEHLLNWELFVQECLRVVKPGGLIAIATANREFILHDYHYDETHLVEWKIGEYEALFSPFFTTVDVKKDCAMFNYYPLNWLLRVFLKPNLTYIGRKP